MKDIQVYATVTLPSYETVKQIKQAHPEWSSARVQAELEKHTIKKRVYVIDGERFEVPFLNE